MKKSYIKPAITFESLTVSANIASGCALIATNSPQFVCAVMDEEAGWTLFADYVMCMMVPGPGDQVCYDVPLAGSNVFSS